MRTVFVEPERCIGCRQCEIACAVEHSASKDLAVAVMETPLPHTRVHVEPGPVASTAFPNRCRHCNPAPCLQVCPTGAIDRDDELGLVLVDDSRCIGCAMCAMVCPFDAVTFHPAADGPGAGVAVALKCDGCAERLRRGDIPACAEVCKVGALVFGELNDLLAAGRVRQGALALAAAASVPGVVETTGALAPWRAWGGALRQVEHDAAAADGHARRRDLPETATAATATGDGDGGGAR